MICTCYGWIELQPKGGGLLSPGSTDQNVSRYVGNGLIRFGVVEFIPGERNAH